MKFIKDGKIITTYDIKAQKELIEQGYKELKEVELSNELTTKKKGL